MKGKLCFIKRKSRNLVSNCRSFCVENISIFENRERTNEKVVDFLTKTPLLFSSSSPLFFEKDARSFAHHAPHCFLIRTSVRVNGHAPAHRALSEFEILAFTLHLHPEVVDTVRIVCEGKALFCLHR